MSGDEMRVRAEDYDTDVDFEAGTEDDFDLPDCDFCDDRGCEECNPEDFAQMHLKWQCDSCAIIEDAIDALEEFIKDLRQYQQDGFELAEPVDNSHFFLERTKSSSSSADGE
jgi:hypothetical protein